MHIKTAVKALATICLLMVLSNCLSQPKPAARIVIKVKIPLVINKDARSVQTAENTDITSEQKKHIDALNQILSSELILVIAPLVDASARTEALKNYYSIVLRDSATTVQLQLLLKQLQQIPILETAYTAPVGEDPGI